MNPPPHSLASHMGVAPFVDRFYVEQPSIPAGITCGDSADGFRGVEWITFAFLLTGRNS